MGTSGSSAGTWPCASDSRARSSFSPPSTMTISCSRTHRRSEVMVAGKLDHIGIAVPDFDATAALYARLGLAVTMKQAFEERGMVRGYLSDGASQLELLQPLRDDTALARFVAERGEQLHHLCFKVDDLAR